MSNVTLQSYTVSGTAVYLCHVCAETTPNKAKWSGECINGYCDGCGAGPSVASWQVLAEPEEPEPDDATLHCEVCGATLAFEDAVLVGEEMQCCDCAAPDDQGTPEQIAQRDAENWADMLDFLATSQAPEAPIAAEEDLDWDLCVRAFSGTSHSPERRASDRRREYAQHVNALHAELLALAPDRAMDVRLAVERYADRYRSLLIVYLVAHSHVVSTLVAGPANFPVERMRKRSDTADRRAQELLDWSAKAVAALRREFDPRPQARGSVRLADDDAADAIRARLGEREAAQQRMVDANKVIRSGKDVEARLTVMGFGPRAIAELLSPPYGRPGFAPYQLSNNSAEIRRLKARLAEVERVAAQADAAGEPEPFDATAEHPAGELFVDEGRVQLRFAERTSKEFYGRLRGASFLWSRNRGTFVRAHTPQALAAARALVGLAG